MKAGLIGAGLMGHGIGLRVLGAGHDLSVLAHRNRGPIDDLVAAGAREARDHAELARDSEVIVLCVSNSSAVDAVMASLEAHLRPGQTVLDMGTSKPQSSRDIADRLAAAGVGFAEAPVAGGPEQAVTGELGAMVGASAADFAAIRPVLEACCARISHMGPVGAGQSAKLISNYLVCGMVSLVADTYRTASEAGIDWRKLYEVMLCGSNNSGVLRKMVGPALEGDFDGYRFSIANGLKDMDYFLDMAESLGGPSALAQAAALPLREAVDAGHGSLYVSRLLEFFDASKEATDAPCD